MVDFHGSDYFKIFISIYYKFGMIKPDQEVCLTTSFYMIEKIANQLFYDYNRTFSTFDRYCKLNPSADEHDDMYCRLKNQYLEIYKLFEVVSKYCPVNFDFDDLAIDE